MEEGKAVGVIVLDEASRANENLAGAVEHFIAQVERSTGVRLEIVTSEEAAKLPATLTRLAVGPSPAADALGLSPDKLELESYRLLTHNNTLYVIGNDPVESSPAPVSRPTLWALNRILEEQLGTRWLWPGELGTYTPRHASLTLPAYDITYQPKLLLRSLRYNPKVSLGSSDPAIDEIIKREAKAWVENHQSGRRGAIRFGHSFGSWWPRFGGTHPEYFAQLPPGHEQPYMKPSRVKLRLANPAVIEQIAQDYIDAGKPLYYNVCPNDGSGFDISPETCAWDIPANQNKSDIFRARGNLTARYVEFWNRLYARLSQINPDVILTTYAYASYRTPPPKARPLKAKAIFGLVPTLDELDIWKGWADTGSGLFLRPNWWHSGGDAPYITVNESTAYIKFAAENGMLGLDMDSIIGYWATQGINYYSVARLMTQPHLTSDQIIDEYVAAFGAGAPSIRAYIAYWQKLASSYDYTASAAKPKKYAQLVKEGKVPRSILNGSKYALPYLYPDRIITPAERLLDEAEARIGANDAEALARVEFLRKGLTSLRATRDQIALGSKLKTNPTPELHAEFSRNAEELTSMRDEMAKAHVIWGQAAIRHENSYQVLIRPENTEFHNINLDGL